MVSLLVTVLLQFGTTALEVAIRSNFTPLLQKVPRQVSEDLSLQSCYLCIEIGGCESIIEHF